MKSGNELQKQMYACAVCRILEREKKYSKNNIFFFSVMFWNLKCVFGSVNVLIHSIFLPLLLGWHFLGVQTCYLTKVRFLWLVISLWKYYVYFYLLKILRVKILFENTSRWKKCLLKILRLKKIRLKIIRLKKIRCSHNVDYLFSHKEK